MVTGLQSCVRSGPKCGWAITNCVVGSPFHCRGASRVALGKGDSSGIGIGHLGYGVYDPTLTGRSPNNAAAIIVSQVIWTQCSNLLLPPPVPQLTIWKCLCQWLADCSSNAYITTSCLRAGLQEEATNLYWPVPPCSHPTQYRVEARRP
jgi:hypothetical protein